MVYVPEVRALVLHGGQTNRSQTIGETWLYSCEGRSWTSVKSAQTPPVGDTPLAYDTRRQRIVAYVGGDYFQQTSLSETWAFDVLNKEWTRLKTEGSPPQGLLGAQLVYDEKADKLVLFGGMKWPGSTMSNATWVYDPQTSVWTAVRTTPSPVGRNYHQMVYEAEAGRVLMWGGEVPQPVWSFDTSTGRWTLLETEGDQVPVVYGSWIYCPPLRQSLLFGGADWLQGQPGNTVALFDLRSLTWSSKETLSGPPPRAWHAAAWDTSQNLLYVFGGGSDRNQFTNELWSLNPEGFVWTKVTLTSSF